MRAPEKHVFLSWTCNFLSKFTSGLTLWFKTTFILKCILNVRQNPYLWEKSWVFALPQMQACIHLWRWLGKFERTIKASETIKISPSSLPVLGISLSDEQTTSVCNALWSPDLNPALTCPWLKPVNGHTHPILVSAYRQDSKSYTEKVKAGRSGSPVMSIKMWICRQLWVELLGVLGWWWTCVPGQKAGILAGLITQNAQYWWSISQSEENQGRQLRQISRAE